MSQARKRSQLTSLWRKRRVSGRLYWRKFNPRWRDWGANDIAMIRDGTARTNFSSYAALSEFLTGEP